MKIAVEYDARLDARKRLVIREAEYEHYHVQHLEDGRILLEPRVLVTPPEISRRTLAMMDASMAAFAEGRVSQPVDPEDLLIH